MCVAVAGAFAAGIASQAAAAAFSAANFVVDGGATFDWRDHTWDNVAEYVDVDGVLSAGYGASLCLCRDDGFTAEQCCRLVGAKHAR